MATFASSKQIAYLQALADKVEEMKKYHEIKCPYIVWRHEKGVTSLDASIRISAYKDIIFWCNVQKSMR